MMHPIHVQAHRGASLEKRENTLDAFVRAVELGANSVELDVHLTQDQVPVVLHDFMLSPELAHNVNRSLWVGEISLHDIKKVQWKNPGFTIPTLSEVFLTLSQLKIGQLAWIDVEFKTHPKFTTFSYDQFVGRVLEQVSVDWSLDRTVFRSFNWELLKSIRKQAPHEKIAALTDEKTLDFSRAILETEPEWLAPHFQTLSQEKLKKVQSVGVKVMPYTVNQKKDWTQLWSWKVDGITTDDPGGLIQFLKGVSD